MTTRTHVVLPASLVESIDALVGKRRRSAFLAEAAEREIRRRRLDEAIDRAAGSWNDADHPELRKGAAEWVRKMRSGDEALRSRRTSAR